MGSRQGFRYEATNSPKIADKYKKKKIYNYFSLERCLKTSLCLKAHKLWPLVFQHPHPAKNSGTCSPAEAHQGTYPCASQSKTRALVLQSSVLKGSRSQMFGKLTQVCRHHLLICPWTWSAAQWKLLPKDAPVIWSQRNASQLLNVLCFQITWVNTCALHFLLGHNIVEINM